MKTAQARASVETLKDVQNDKSLKTKAEKERRIRYIDAKADICLIIFQKISLMPSDDATYRIVSEIYNGKKLRLGATNNEILSFK